MSVTLWDTDGGAVIQALAAERRAAGGSTSGLALTLVVSVDERRVGEAEEATTVATAAHPCRLIVVVRRSLAAETRLDAEVAIGGRLGPTEAIVLRMWGRLTLHPESVVLPLLAPDAPVMTWWHGPPPDAVAEDPLGVLADRRLTDCAQAADPLAALRTRASDYAPGDTDLAWTRTTRWRAMLASAFDSVGAPAAAGHVVSQGPSPTAALLAGWLQARLGVPVTVDDGPGPGIMEVAVTLAGDAGTVRISRNSGRLTTVSLPGQPDRRIPLGRRSLGEWLGVEMRRLDADEIYAEALSAATGVAGLSGRPAVRTLRWTDPATTP